jgi:hypothetical protein
MTLDTVFGDRLLKCPKSHGIVKYPLKSFILMCLLKYAVFYTSENWINIESDLMDNLLFINLPYILSQINCQRSYII